MDSKEKIRFRATVKWKKFRDEFIAKKNFSCELCGTKYTGKRKRLLNVHHLDEENYTDLNEKKFKVLCSFCHRNLIENFTMKLEKGTLPNTTFKQWISLFLKAGLITKEKSIYYQNIKKEKTNNANASEKR